MADPSAAESLSVLLVSARRASRDELAQALDGGRGDANTRLFWVSQPNLAATRAQELMARIILVDDELGGASQAALIQELGSRLPDAAILALVNADAMGHAREALLAGARAFVTRPLNSDEITAAFRQVTARPASQTAEPQSSRLGRLVVFCGPKGGTGRTTAAINTAISLRQLEDLPLALVDADYAAPAVDVQLNLHERVNVVDLLPNIAQLDRELVDSVLVEHPAGLRVLLAPPPADITVHMTLPQLEQILLWLKRMFPWVIVDLGLPIDELALGFLDAADLVIMSANPEMIGLRNAQLMAAEFRSRGYPEDKVWLLLNRFDLYGGLLDQDVEEYLGLKVRYRIPNSQVAATDNVNRGVPFVLSSPRSSVSRAYQGLARELVRCLPLRTWSTEVTEFAASAEAATAVGLARSARAPARPNGHTPGETGPALLAEAGAALARPEAGAATPAEPVSNLAEPVPDLSVEPAVAVAAVLNSTDAGRVLVQARRDSAPQVAGSQRITWLVAAREWTGVVFAVLAILASLSVLGLAVSRITANQRQSALVARLDSLSPTPAALSAAGPTASPSRQPSGVAVVSPTPFAPAASPSVVTTRSAEAVPAPAATFAAATLAAVQAPPTASATPAPSATATEASTATTTSTSMPTLTPSPTLASPTPSPTVAPPTAVPTRRPVASPTLPPKPSAVPTPAVSAPMPVAPAPNATLHGTILFQWQSSASLPAGAGYEVVWWNNGENPLKARGIAPPVTTTSLQANLDVLFGSGQLTSNDIFWTVLIVTIDPYTRLTQPEAAAAGKIVYQPGGPPPKVR